MKKFVIFVFIILIVDGIGGYFIFKKPVSFEPKPPFPEQVGRCGDNICDEIEKANPSACPADCGQLISQQSSISNRDSDFKDTEFIWGTEGQIGEGDGMNGSLDASRLSPLVQETITAINGLGIKYIKFRIAVVNGLPVPSYIDEAVKVFKSNGWSMVPMFTRDPGDADVTVQEMNDYASFIVSFLDTHKSSANIRLIEQQNAPQDFWADTSAKLLQMSNVVYDQVKARHPDVQVGTPGFEYAGVDYSKNATSDPKKDRADSQFEQFLDKANGAKFDFWAFHGYPILQAFPGGSFRPPTTVASGNVYGAIPGILEIRKKLDANGWQDRPMIDTEHVPYPAGTSLSDNEDALDAAYIAQDLVIRRALKAGEKPALAGVMPLKIIARGEDGERVWGSLKSDGSLSKTVKAFGLLLSKLKGYQPDSRMSGRFGDESQVWVEKFRAGDRELYVFFKPFKESAKSPLQLDNELLSYSLTLRETPQSATLTDINGGTKTLVATKIMTLSAQNAPGFLEIVYSK